MTRAEAIEILKKLIEAMQGHVTVLPTPERIAAIRLAIASLETDEAYQLEYEKPTTKNDLGVDCIKKSDAINIIQDMHGLARADVISDAVNRIIAMPSIPPQEPKTGHWITKPHVYGVTYCSECDFELKIDDTNYCPNCGAKMFEPQESEDKG